MATRIGIRELRDTLTATIRRVRLGETIEVTHDGRPVAVLSPYSEDRIERLLASGRATPPAANIHPLPEPLAAHARRDSPGERPPRRARGGRRLRQSASRSSRARGHAICVAELGPEFLPR